MFKQNEQVDKKRSHGAYAVEYNAQQQQAYFNQMQGQGQGHYNAPPPPPGAVVQWMGRPNPIPGCPPGLEYLTQVDSLRVQQKVELLEAFTGWETNNKYAVYNTNGQQVYFAFENTDTCMRICCGQNRGFTIHVVDNMNQEVLRIIREFKCCTGCCWCAGCCNHCSFEVSVVLPTGEVMGYVKQKGSCWKATYGILDAARNEVLHIQGPCCIFDGPCCPCDNEFNLIGNDGSVIGKVAKVYSGFIRELVSKADSFTINFPMDLDVKLKSVMLGALFLIDFMFFERKDDNNY